MSHYLSDFCISYQSISGISFDSSFREKLTLQLNAKKAFQFRKLVTQPRESRLIQDVKSQKVRTNTNKYLDQYSLNNVFDKLFYVKTIMKYQYHGIKCLK